MLALISHWKLKNGLSVELSSAVEELIATIRRDEPGTLVFASTVPCEVPPIGPPPEYRLHPELTETEGTPAQLVFIEVYRDHEAYQAHLLGPFMKFIDAQLEHFETPWQGRIRPKVMYLDARSILLRQEA